MARAKRVQDVGFYYISNRSVELRNAFIDSGDYRLFIDYLCLLSKSHDFVVHSYTLLPHSYHLLLETKKENLSMIMKLLGRKYALYFNQKYGRNGALWEGRYKSVYMEDMNYAYYFIAYMENLPMLTGITLKIQNYAYGSYRQFVGLEERLRCLENSIIFKRFNTLEDIRNFFKKEQKKEFIDNIIEILRLKNRGKKVNKKVTKSKDVDFYFSSSKCKKDETESVYNAYISGVSQAKIADFLGLTQQAIYKKIKKYKLENNLK